MYDKLTAIRFRVVFGSIAYLDGRNIFYKKNEKFEVTTRNRFAERGNYILQYSHS
jgi:hypothetical protein